LVSTTDSIIPDIAAAIIIIAIAFYGAIIILRQAIKEIKSYRHRQIHGEQVEHV
jgi:Co/Zn/Cd efflux system component